MKLMIILSLMACRLNNFSQTIKGKVLDMDTKQPLTNAFVYLLAPETTEDTLNVYYWQNDKYKVITKTKTDSLGKYSFQFLTQNVYNIVAEFPMPKSERLNLYGRRQEIDSNINITAKSKYFKTFYLMVTCPYDKTKKQLFCPRCKKTDRVVPIIFGLPLFDEDGNINGKSIDDYYLAGCYIDMYCNPSKHCNRCNKNF